MEQNRDKMESEREAFFASDDKTNIQVRFFQQLRESLPPTIGLAEEIADILGGSLDSAYRRIRGHTSLTFDEIELILRKHPISVDELFAKKTGKVTFTYTNLTDKSENFELYLARLVGHMEGIRGLANKYILYAAEEFPLFYSFHSAVFAEFKLFYWQRAVMNCSEYQHKKYRRGLIPSSLVDLAQKCYDCYYSIPSTEIWSDQTVLTGLRQVQHFFDLGIVDKQTALELLNEYKLAIETIERNAAVGKKTLNGKSVDFTLLSTDVTLGTNCIRVQANDLVYSYVSFNTLNSLTTTNKEFCQETEFWMKNLEQKSILISGVAERQRYRFFADMYEKVDRYIQKIQDK
jgi:hypothetical protein